MQLRFHDGDDMEAHIAYINRSFQQIVDLGLEMTPDDWRSATMLGGLPDSYDNLVMSLESRPASELTAAKVQSTLIDEYRRRVNKNQGEQNGSAAMFVGKKSQSNTKKKGVFCFKCKQKGHKKPECPNGDNANTQKPNYGQSSKNDDTKPKANLIAGNDDDGDAYEQLFHVGKVRRQEGWVIDSGATSHYCSNKHLFCEIDLNFTDKVLVANHDLEDAVGRGRIDIDVVNSNGAKSRFRLNNVLFVPTLSTNYISVRKLNAEGFKVTFTEKMTCEMNFNGNQIAVEHLSGGLYMLKLPKLAYSLQGHPDNCIHYWHRVLGHRDMEIIKRLVADGHVDGVEIVDCKTNESCGVRLEGKMTRVKIPKHATKHSKSVLDLVHTDVCGPMQTETPSKKRYMLTFIDDHTRYTVTYLIRQKSEVHAKLKEYIEMVENRFNKRIKMLRSDRGGEYTGKQVSSFKWNIQRATVLFKMALPNGKIER